MFDEKKMNLKNRFIFIFFSSSGNSLDGRMLFLQNKQSFFLIPSGNIKKAKINRFKNKYQNKQNQ
jgi:hypothetical protein